MVKNNNIERLKCCYCEKISNRIIDGNSICEGCYYKFMIELAQRKQPIIKIRKLGFFESIWVCFGILLAIPMFIFSISTGILIFSLTNVKLYPYTLNAEALIFNVMFTLYLFIMSMGYIITWYFYDKSKQGKREHA